MSNFRIGQKVICVDPNGTNKSGKPELIKGQIYTVIGIEHFAGDQWLKPFLGLHLEGIPRQIESEFGRHSPVPFRSSRFRPVVTLSEDIALFKAISEDVYGRLEALEEELNRA